MADWRAQPGRSHFLSEPQALRAVSDEASSSSAAAAEDARLMAAFARGDAAAFDRLYARHQAALYRFVRRVLGPALAAQTDEVFQDTWLRVVQARGRFVADGGASFRTWLFTLAQNRAIDQLRRSGRELQAPDDTDEERLPLPVAAGPGAEAPTAGATLAGAAGTRPRAGLEA